VLADPSKAREKIDDALGDLEHSMGERFLANALIRLAEVLAAPPARREELLWGSAFDTWYPGRARVGE
jgi:hypothetical protein